MKNKYILMFGFLVITIFTILNVTAVNHPPSSVDLFESNSSTPYDTIAGGNIKFLQPGISDVDGDDIGIIVCSTNAQTNGICNANTICSSGYTAGAGDRSCVITSSQSSPFIANVTVFMCDEQLLCSQPEAPTIEYYVNHIPSYSSIIIDSSDWPAHYPTSTFTCGGIRNDPDIGYDEIFVGNVSWFIGDTLYYQDNDDNPMIDCNDPPGCGVDVSIKCSIMAYDEFDVYSDWSVNSSALYITTTTEFDYLLNGSIIEAAYFAYDNAFKKLTGATGYVFGILFIVFLFLLYIVNRSIVVNFIMGLIGLIALFNYLPKVILGIIVGILVLELAGIIFGWVVKEQ